MWQKSGQKRSYSSHLRVTFVSDRSLNHQGVTYAHLGPIWYHLEPSDDPYSQTSSLTD